MKVSENIPNPQTSSKNLHSHTWYLLADGEKALVLYKDGQHFIKLANFRPTDEFTPTVRQKSKGHSGPFSQGGTYYTANPMDRDNRHDQTVFLKHVVEWLEKAYEDQAFDELVVVAANKNLGTIIHESCKHKGLNNAISQKVNKDLIKMPIHELENQLLH